MLLILRNLCCLSFFWQIHPHWIFICKLPNQKIPPGSIPLSPLLFFLFSLLSLSFSPPLFPFRFLFFIKSFFCDFWPTNNQYDRKLTGCTDIAKDHFHQPYVSFSFFLSFWQWLNKFPLYIIFDSFDSFLFFFSLSSLIVMDTSCLFHSYHIDKSDLHLYFSTSRHF